MYGCCAWLQHLAQPAPCPTAAAARAAVRAAGGIRQLIGLLTPRCTPVGGPDLRGVAAYCLLGLAQEPALCRILARLQVGSESSPAQLSCLMCGDRR